MDTICDYCDGHIDSRDGIKYGLLFFCTSQCADKYGIDPDDDWYGGILECGTEEDTYFGSQQSDGACYGFWSDE